MIQKLVQALDREIEKAQRGAIRPITGRNVSYEAGRRIGVAQGLLEAKQAIINVATDNEKDDDSL